MSVLDLQELQSLLKKQGILISFSGQFSQGIIEELSEAIEKHLNKENLAKGDIYNVIAIFVEQAQNIRNYTTNTGNNINQDNYDSIVSSGIVTIGKDQDGYFIYSGNLIENKHLDILKQKLQELQNLDKEHLKKRYKEQVRKEKSDTQTGAGLGLIDIFRKATMPVYFTFSDYNEELKFYSLKVTV